MTLSISALHEKAKAQFAHLQAKADAYYALHEEKGDYADFRIAESIQGEVLDKISEFKERHQFSEAQKRTIPAWRA